MIEQNYRGLRICCQRNIGISKHDLCQECSISPLEKRRDVHLLRFMHQQLHRLELLKSSRVNTRLHQGPVFKSYKPNNEKAKHNVLYRSAISRK